MSLTGRRELETAPLDWQPSNSKRVSSSSLKLPGGSLMLLIGLPPPSTNPTKRLPLSPIPVLQHPLSVPRDKLRDATESGCCFWKVIVGDGHHNSAKVPSPSASVGSSSPIGTARDCDTWFIPWLICRGGCSSNPARERRSDSSLLWQMLEPCWEPCRELSFDDSRVALIPEVMQAWKALPCAEPEERNTDRCAVAASSRAAGIWRQVRGKSVANVASVNFANGTSPMSEGVPGSSSDRKGGAFETPTKAGQTLGAIAL
mmetsp:Transcript_15273/g.24337  ORF Transcript_15273/g.24337 Transcript_15273/m.24337 type:complete len:259 (+) Transcript_15273:1622-2398(+)